MDPIEPLGVDAPVDPPLGIVTAPTPAPVSWPRRLLRGLVTLFINRGERRPRALWRLAGQAALLVLIGKLGSFVLANAAGLGSRLGGSLQPSAATQLRWIAMAAFGTVVITLAVGLARRLLDRRSLVSLGLGWDRVAAGDLLFGFAVAGALQSVVFAIHLAAGWITFTRFAWETRTASEVALNLATMVVVFAFVGWHEELLTRGYWLQNIADGLNRYWGVALSSIVFSLGHLGNPHAGWLPTVGLVAAGLFLALPYLLTGRLWLSIGVHWGWNLFEGPLLGLPVSGISTPPLLEYTVRGPQLLTGGEFGPEAGLVLFPSLVLGALAIVWYTRGRRKAEPPRDPVVSTTSTSPTSDD